MTTLIAHVIHRLDVGGMENGLVNLINCMPRERYRHAIVSLTDQTDFAHRLNRDDVEIVTLDKQPGNDFGLYGRLWRTFRRLRPAIVHTRNLSTIEAALPAALAGVPYRVHGEHGRDIEDLDGSRTKYRLLRRAVSPFVHRFIALSGDLERYLVSDVGISPERVTRIINGVDTSKFHPGEGSGVSGVVTIGTVTRMKEVKDPLTLARAFVELVRRGLGPRVRLVMVGDGPLLNRVEDVLRGGGALPRALLLGHRDDIPALMQSFDVFSLSSQVEGISNTILEAMASGLPVVATRVGGNDELVDEGVTGTLVPPRNPEALAEALARYVGSGKLRSEQGRAGRLRARERFSLDTMVKRYVDVYDTVLGFEPGPLSELEGGARVTCAE